MFKCKYITCKDVCVRVSTLLVKDVNLNKLLVKVYVRLNTLFVKMNVSINTFLVKINAFKKIKIPFLFNVMAYINKSENSNIGLPIKIYDVFASICTSVYCSVIIFFVFLN